MQRKNNTNSKLFKTIIMKIKTYLFSVVSICMLFNLTVAKTAGKAVSAVGAAIAVYDFADCMDWI